MIVISLLMTAIVFVVTVLSCVSDIRSLRIPNWHSLVILCCFAPAWWAMPGLFGALWQHVGAMGFMFVMTYAMFILGMVGGGDSKFATALGLWIGLKGLILFMFYMAIIGGVVGIASLAIRKYKPFKNLKAGSWAEQAQSGRNVVPYGLAIGLGAWVTFFHTGLIYNQLNEVIRIIH